MRDNYNRLNKNIKERIAKNNKALATVTNMNDSNTNDVDEELEEDDKEEKKLNLIELSKVIHWRVLAINFMVIEQEQMT